MGAARALPEGRADLKTRFQPGQIANPHGRPRKLLGRVDEILHKHGVHPVEKLLELMPDLPPGKQAEVWLQLIVYIQPKPKDYTEERALMDELRQMSTKDLIKIAKENLPAAQAAELDAAG